MDVACGSVRSCRVTAARFVFDGGGGGGVLSERGNEVGDHLLLLLLLHARYRCFSPNI